MGNAGNLRTAPKSASLWLEGSGTKSLCALNLSSWSRFCDSDRDNLVAQMVKHLPAMPDTRVRSLGWEDLLEKEMATHSSNLAWKIPWIEEPGRLQSKVSQRVGQD